LASALSSGSNFGWSLFFCPLAGASLRETPLNLHGSTADCAFVPLRTLPDNRANSFAGRSGTALPKVNRFGG